MQKFTRPITREVELGGERLAFTFAEQGVTVRPVGSRRPPRELSWGALVCHLTGRPVGNDEQPSEADVAAALQAIRGGSSSSKKPSPEDATAAATAPPSAEVAAPTGSMFPAEGQPV